MGNVVLWKPSNTQLHSAKLDTNSRKPASLPESSTLPGNGADVGDIAIRHPALAGLHFTGSKGVFQHLWSPSAPTSSWSNVSTNRRRDRRYTSSCHPSADPQALAVAIVRGGFEYQGQKCSAASRLYIPNSLWGAVSEQCVAMIGDMKMGNVTDFSNFLGPVIDGCAFKKHSGYLEIAASTGEILTGGGADDSEGWFVEPTLVRCDDPRPLMREEIFVPSCLPSFMTTRSGLRHRVGRSNQPIRAHRRRLFSGPLCHQ